MSDIAIQVKNLSKSYRIGNGPQGDRRFGYKSLRDVMSDVMAAPLRRAQQQLRGHTRVANATSEILWALDNVSFDVKQGEVVGIIGRNGAGKSTLLKILAHITEPTKGEVELHGRIGSLLEVGTGFHPELTGRENIYLNGAILGMKRAEIVRHFDEIVAFAETERFLDTPVKHYSSGMYMRLAFAVAAHLEPEILLIDEVLAVGDAQFQEKCLGKMGDVAKTGRTVLFVSHTMNAIATLCHRGILLETGRIAFDGAATVAIQRYLENHHSRSAHWVANGPQPDQAIALCAAQVQDANGEIRGEFTNQESITLVFDVQINRWQPDLIVGFDLISSQGIKIFTSYHNDCRDFSASPLATPGIYRFQTTITPPLLNTNTYYISPFAILDQKQVLFCEERALTFKTEFTLLNPKRVETNRQGLIGPLLNWKIGLTT